MKKILSTLAWLKENEPNAVIHVPSISMAI